MGRTSNTKSLNHAGSLEKREVILAALARAITHIPSTDRAAGEPDEENIGYYTLSPEELSAVVNGDMEKIENWVNNLDQRRAAWLLGRIIKDR